MFEKFTDRARRVVVLAQEEARLLGHASIGSEHLLLGLVHESDSVAGQALTSAGVTLEALRRWVLDAVGDGGAAPSGPIPFTPSAKRSLEVALNLATRAGDDHVGTEHLLVSVLHQDDGLVAQIVADLGIDAATVEQHLIDARADHRERVHAATPEPTLVAQELTPAALGVQRIVRAVASLQPLRSYHYLLALFDDPSSVAAKVLASFDIDRDTVARRITAMGIEGTTDVLPGE